MQITTAVSADIPQLCTLLDSLFAQEAEFTPDREAQTRGLNTVIDGQNTGDILVAKTNSEIIGMVNILYTVSTALGARVGILEDMVVSPKGRGLGVGSKLLAHALDFARENGCKRITLLTDSDNKDAQRFYQKHGFSLSSMVPLRISL